MYRLSAESRRSGEGRSQGENLEYAGKKVIIEEMSVTNREIRRSK
jgi:hypothetical protein